MMVVFVSRKETILKWSREDNFLYSTLKLKPGEARILLVSLSDHSLTVQMESAPVVPGKGGKIFCSLGPQWKCSASNQVN